MIRAETLRLPLLGLALATAAPALAQESSATVQQTSANDPRLQTEIFDESRVFTIRGKTRVQTTIKFAPDELIQNVAVGDSNAWQIQPNQAQTILFVKPRVLTLLTERTASGYPSNPDPEFLVQ